MKSEKISFKNHAGEDLAAVIEWPEDEQPLGFALFAHCFTCTKNIAAAVNISRALSRSGLPFYALISQGWVTAQGSLQRPAFPIM